MTRLLVLTPAELTRDPRARRQSAAALARGVDVVGLCGQVSGEAPAELPGVVVYRVGRGSEARPREYAGGSQPRRLNPVAREGVGLYRMLRLAARTTRLWRAGSRVGHVAVIHANDFDTLPAASLLARGGRSRLVYDAHELYTDFEPDPPRLYRALAGAIEARLARHADVVMSVSEPMADELRRRFRLRRAPVVVLNAPALEKREPPPTPRNGPLRVIYQGTFGPGRPLSDLLEALRLAPSATLTLRVVHAVPELLRAEVARYSLEERVAIADPLPPDRLVEGLRDFDVGIVFDRPLTRNSELSFPNKLFDYLMAGLAIVGSRLPSLSPFIEGERLGLTFEPGRPADLAACLERLAADRDALAELRVRSRALAVERYNAGTQATTLAAAWGLPAELPG